MSLIAWAFVLVIFVPALGLILAEIFTAPKMPPDRSQLDVWDEQGGPR